MKKPKVNTAPAPTEPHLPAKGDPTLAKMARVYVKMRDKKAEIMRLAEEECAAIQTKMSVIEIEMLKILQAQDANSVATEEGTIYRQIDIKPSCADWEIFYDWIKDNDAFDALERRIKKTFIKEYIEQHDDKLPPGVNVIREWKVTVRRK